MSVKANLRVVLMANDLVIAESVDAALWQQVLRVINNPSDVLDSHSTATSSRSSSRLEPSATEDSVANFAEYLDLAVEDVVGAVAPQREPPYLHLDARYWEAFRRSRPARGPAAVAPLQLAGTLLALWFKHADLGQPTVAQAQAVLGSIGVRDNNPSRAIHNCLWLQTRPGGFQINPAEITQAIAIARQFCTRTPARRED